MFTRTYDSRQPYVRTFTCVGEATIHAAEGGAGPPLLLLHGLGGSCRWWGHNLEGLAKHFRVYAPDMPGFGLSRSREFFNLHRAADDLVRWMQQIDLPRAHVVGHSMGGFVALDLAARYPEFVDRLVLVSAAVRATDLKPQLNLHQLKPNLRRIKPNLRGLNTLPLLLGDICRCNPRNILAATQGMMLTKVHDRLQHIQAPTMVLWGDQDAMVPVQQGYALAQQLPCEELVMIEDAGHHPMWDQPEIFNNELVNFLHQPQQRVIPLPPRRMAA
jgi:pimeloyl-ACP methyl ester carboxylesterase